MEVDHAQENRSQRRPVVDLDSHSAKVTICVKGTKNKVEDQTYCSVCSNLNDTALHLKILEETGAIQIICDLHMKLVRWCG